MMLAAGAVKPAFLFNRCLAAEGGANKERAARCRAAQWGKFRFNRFLAYIKNMKTGKQRPV
jgi:hypothetical protein